MADPKLGFRAVYDSHRAMEADHSAYMTHGGLIVRCTHDEAPEPNTDMVLRIEAPGGRAFDLEARAGHYLKKKGFMVSFEDAAETRQALDGFVASETFRSAIAMESMDVTAPKFESFDPAQSPPPTPFDEQTPVDPRAGPPVVDTDTTAALHPDIDKVLTKPRRAAKTRRAARSEERTATAPTQIRRPASGTEYPVYVVKYPTVADYALIVEELGKSGLLTIPIEEETSGPNDVVLLRIVLPGFNQYEIFGVLEAVSAASVTVRVPIDNETLRKAVLYPTTIAARKRVEGEQKGDRGPATALRIVDVAPDAEYEKLPIRRRLARMGMDDKINMALSGNREERMALAMDGNRAVHHYLLKNAKISLDEIAFMSRLPSLNPDVLEKIAENPSYTQNPSVTKALVYNPKTPIRTAIRLLDRLPRPEIMNLAKRNNMNLRLVMAAKKKIERFKG